MAVDSVSQQPDDDGVPGVDAQRHGVVGRYLQPVGLDTPLNAVSSQQGELRRIEH